MELSQASLTMPDHLDAVLMTGVNDEYLRLIENSFDARITFRGNQIDIAGGAPELQMLTALFADLIKTLEEGHTISTQALMQSIDLIRGGEFAPSLLRDDVLLAYRGKAIRAKTGGQKRYVDAIRSHTVTFAIGPAGTGKTYLAMAMAIAALKRKEVARVILTRPVVEAGESLGYLPGTLSEKIDPYIRPLYDALFDMADMERANQLIEQGVIEIAPLAFMRGRTLNDSFIILDEAQNTTPDQMKMFLTRLGFGSRMVVTGDVTQLDLPKRVSGLISVRRVLEGVRDISFVDLTGKDVVRHSLVQRIVAAYDAADAARQERLELCP
ncbi:MAG: PhoH family protein [Coriobacteriales bacterium]|jgi:phosphate starvation-inducible PhoH-like protein|nr:PhoH family protein [Coriobacteriales bacterium]